MPHLIPPAPAAHGLPFAISQLNDMTQESNYLLALARLVAAPFLALPGAQAAMVTGSVARGESDRYSDIDMAIYYTEIPPDETLEEIRLKNGGSERIWTMGERSSGSIAEAYDVHGVQCQLIHSTLGAQDSTIAEVFEQMDPGTPAHKAMSGIADCLPLHGDDIIHRWKQLVSNYPDELARAVVEKHLAFFPVWYMQPYLAPRDATLWIVQSLLEAVQNILGVLAGLNRQYYSTFQFKRMEKFIGALAVKPDDLGARIERIIRSELPEAAVLLEALVRDTVEIVERMMPDVDTSKIRKRLGVRREAWEMAPIEVGK